MYPKQNNRKALIIILILATLGLGIASIYTSIRLQNSQEPVDTSAATKVCSDIPQNGSCINLQPGSICGNDGVCTETGTNGTTTSCECRTECPTSNCATQGQETCLSGQTFRCTCFTPNGCSSERCIYQQVAAGSCNTNNCGVGSSGGCEGSAIGSACGTSGTCTTLGAGNLCACQIPQPVCDGNDLCGSGAGCGSGAACSESSACNQECELSNGVRTGYMFACRGNSVQRIQATQTCPPPQVNSNTDTNNNTGNNSNNTNNNTDNTTTNNNTNTQTDSVITNTNTSVTNITSTTNSSQNLPVTSVHDNLPYYYIIGALILFGGIIFVFRKKI